MIETKEFVIAENPEEKFWKELKDKISKDTDNMKKSIEINEWILELVNKKIKK